MNGRSCSNKRKGNGNNLISRTNPQSQQSQVQGDGSRIDRDRVARTACRRELMLKNFDRFTQDESSAFQNHGDGLIDLVLDLSILRFQIQEGDHAAILLDSTWTRLPRRDKESAAASKMRTTRSP